MAFPKLLQKLFQDSGAGSMLRTDIIPMDSALSDTSTNGVQNKIIKAAIQAVADVCYQVGDLRLYAGSNVPDGWFRCDGSTIADMATNYPKLYAVLGTNVLPNYSGRTIYGASSDINATIESGLPNIQGRLMVTAGKEQGTYAGFPTIADGCFSADNWHATGLSVYFVATGVAKTPDDTHMTATVFNAASSNAIYGASTTVQPPAVKVAVLIKHD